MSRKGYINAEEDLRLSYQQVGEGQPSVIVPGACLLGADLNPLAGGHTLLLYDMRGRGGSDPSPDPWAAWTTFEVTDLEAVRRSFGLSKVSLIGWSYMGGVVPLYALNFPQRVERLVLMCPISPRSPAPYDDLAAANRKAQERIDPRGVERLEEQRAKGKDLEDPVAYCRDYRSVYTPRQMGRPEALDRMRSDPSVYPNEWPDALSSHWQRHFPEESWQRDWREMLHGLPHPTLVIHGAEDLIPLASSREWASTLPNARLLVIPGAGHFPHLEAPEIFFPAVDQFLKGEWPSEATIVHT